jgi:hypothetical protein
MAADSRCAGDPAFLEALTQQIPDEQRAAEDTAEWVAQVRVGPGTHPSATITVIDRVLDTPAGSRELELATEDCAQIADALSLIVGVLVEAGRGGPPAEAEETKEQATSPIIPPAPVAPLETRAEPVPIKPKRYRWLGPRSGHDLVLAAGPSFGLLPGLSWAGTFGWAIRVHGLWPVSLSATTQLPKQSPDGRAEFSVAYGAVHVCPLAYAWSRLRVRGCPGLSLGMFTAQGRGFLAQQRSKELLALAGVEVAADLRVWGVWTLGLAARLDAPLIRTRFVYYREDGKTPELHEARSLTIQSFLVTGVRFR